MNGFYTSQFGYEKQSVHEATLIVQLLLTKYFYHYV